MRVVEVVGWSHTLSLQSRALHVRTPRKIHTSQTQPSKEEPCGVHWTHTHSADRTGLHDKMRFSPAYSCTSYDVRTRHYPTRNPYSYSSSCMYTSCTRHYGTHSETHADKTGRTFLQITHTAGPSSRVGPLSAIYLSAIRGAVCGSMI